MSNPRRRNENVALVAVPSTSTRLMTGDKALLNSLRSPRTEGSKRSKTWAFSTRYNPQLSLLGHRHEETELLLLTYSTCQARWSAHSVLHMELMREEGINSIRWPGAVFGVRFAVRNAWPPTPGPTITAKQELLAPNKICSLPDLLAPN